MQATCGPLPAPLDILATVDGEEGSEPEPRPPDELGDLGSEPATVTDAPGQDPLADVSAALPSPPDPTISLGNLSGFGESLESWVTPPMDLTSDPWVLEPWVPSIAPPPSPVERADRSVFPREITTEPEAGRSGPMRRTVALVALVAGLIVVEALVLLVRR